MAKKNQEENVAARLFDKYSDYIALFLGLLGISFTVGAIGPVPILPDWGTSGLVDLGGQFWEVNGTIFTHGAALAAVLPVLAYGTNQVYDMIDNIGEAWRTKEFGAFATATSIPVAHTFLTEVSDLTAGDVAMQLVFVGVYLFVLGYGAQFGEN